MDLFQFNKVAGAVLGTLLFVQAVALISNAIFSHPNPAKPGDNLPAPQQTAAPGAKAAPEESLPSLLAKADPKKGEADTQVCHLCHNFGKSEGIKIGPPLWGVVGRPKGSVPGFDYSAGMKAKGGTWTFEDIFTFIKDPPAYVPGTKMTFSGEPDPKKRADIVAYLRTLSDNPLPLPKAAAAAAAPSPATPAATPPAAPAAPAAKPPAAAAAPSAAAPPPAAAPAAPAAQAPAATPATSPAAPAAQAPAATPATPPAAAPAAQAPAATPATPPAAPAAQSPAATPATPPAAPAAQSPAATPPAGTPAAPAAQPPAAPAPQ
jgi:cytochrome c